MVKKASAKRGKTTARPTKAKPPQRAKSAARVAGKQTAQKYDQAGAPWWKQHLPSR